MFITKGLLHFLMFLNIFLVVSSHCWFHWLDLSHLGGWADRRRCPPRPRARIGLAGLGPKVVSLAGHDDVFLCRLKQGDTVKVTVGNRLKRHWIQHTIVDAGRRLFGAIIYLHALIVGVDINKAQGLNFAR